MASCLLEWGQEPSADYRNGAVAIGNFDGVHRGHASLLNELREQARRIGGPPIVVTFDPHPLQLLQPAKFQPVLTTMKKRVELLEQLGFERVLILHTTPNLLQVPAVDFFQTLVGKQLAARAMVEGTNFGFGHNREGTILLLRSLCQNAGIHLSVVPPYSTADGVPVSSSRVRQALERGAVREAAELLGHSYQIQGRVVLGKQRGQGLGFPTANLEQITTIVPKDGVYAVWAHANQTIWPAAANVGPNPTFGEGARKIEVHLIGFEGNLYGRTIAVDFYERLRDTRPFSGPAQLIEQLRLDIKDAQRSLGAAKKEISP